MSAESRRWQPWLAAGLLWLVSAGSWAAAPLWESLSASEQALLKPALQAEAVGFNQLPEARREKLLQGARRWLAMTPEQRAAASAQLGAWRGMNSAERKAALERRERFRQLSPEQQQALLERHRQFLALPADQQRRLRADFEREQQRLDDSLRGLDFPGTQPGVPLPAPRGGLLPR